MFEPCEEGTWRTCGNWYSPYGRGMMRYAIVWTGRCFLIGGDGISVPQSRGRYPDKWSLVRCIQ